MALLLLTFVWGLPRSVVFSLEAIGKVQKNSNWTTKTTEVYIWDIVCREH